MFQSSGFRLPQLQSRHSSRRRSGGTQADPACIPLVTQKPAQQQLAGRLALAAFVKRPQADVQIGAGENYTEVSDLIKGILYYFISIFNKYCNYITICGGTSFLT
jgi:hypothetical protein